MLESAYIRAVNYFLSPFNVSRVTLLVGLCLMGGGACSAGAEHARSAAPEKGASKNERSPQSSSANANAALGSDRNTLSGQLKSPPDQLSPTRGEHLWWKIHASSEVPVGTDPSWGDFKAPVTIVAFGDYNCSFTRRAYVTLRALQKRYGRNKLRLVFKPTPLWKPHYAAELLTAVHQIAGKEKFWRVTHRSLTEGVSKKERLAYLIAGEGLDGGALDAHIANGEPGRAVRANNKLAKTLRVEGLPTFYINGLRINGAQPEALFIDVVEGQLRKAEQLLTDGAAPEAVYPRLVAKQIGQVAPSSTTGEKNAPREQGHASCSQVHVRAGDPVPQVQKQEKDPRRQYLTYFIKEKSETVLSRRWSDEVYQIPIFQDDPWRGAKTPLVTIVQFSDLQCPYSRMVEKTLDKLLAHHGEDLRIVWKDNPLAMHPQAKRAAAVARFVYQMTGRQKFWNSLDFVRGWGMGYGGGRRPLEKHLKDAGLSWQGATNYEQNASFVRKLEQSQDLALGFGATSTPHFFVNGKRLAGAVVYQHFAALIDAELSAARKLVDAGVSRSKLYDTIMRDAEPLPRFKTIKVAPPPADAPWIGAENPKIIAQLWTNFECPGAADLHADVIEKLKRESDVRIVLRHLPLSFERFQLAAEAAYEVFLQKGNKEYWLFHKMLFAQMRYGRLDRTSVEILADKHGVDLSKLREALNTRKHRARIEADVQAALEAGITQSPSLVVSDLLVPGSNPKWKYEYALHLVRKRP